MRFGSSRMGMLVLLAAFAPYASAQQCGAGGSASAADNKVTCGQGLLPLMIEGDIKGTLEVPAGKLTFPGKHVLLGYCGYPAPGSAPSLIPVGENAAGQAYDKLPFILKGSATGTLHTSEGDIVLQGDQNDVATCLPAMQGDRRMSVARPRQAP